MIYAIKLRDVDRKDKVALEHKAGRFLLRYGLLKEYGIDVSECTILKNRHGKPFLKEYPDVFFNISHCKCMAVCVIGRTPVGIDVELKRACKESLMKRVLSLAEFDKVKASGKEDGNTLEFFKYWTLKEAYGKAVGVGMLYDYANTTFKWKGENIVCPDNEYRIWQQVLNEEIVISVCRKQAEDFKEDIEFVEIDYNELEEKE